MDDFSFDPAGALKASAFRRLMAVRVNSPSRDPAFNSQPDPPPDQQRIFREVPPPDPRSQGSLAGLEAAVTSISDASVSVRRIADEYSGEVSDVNADSSGASVSEVETAARLAEDLSVKIGQNAEQSRQAQAARVSASAVTRFLG